MSEACHALLFLFVWFYTYTVSKKWTALFGDNTVKC